MAEINSFLIEWGIKYIENKDIIRKELIKIEKNEETGENLTNVRELVEASVSVVSELLETSEEMQQNANELDEKINAFQV